MNDLEETFLDAGRVAQERQDAIAEHLRALADLPQGGQHLLDSRRAIQERQDAYEREIERLSGLLCPQQLSFHPQEAPKNTSPPAGSLAPSPTHIHPGMGAAPNIQAFLHACRAAQERQDAVRREMEQWLQMLKQPREAPTNASPPADHRPPRAFYEAYLLLAKEGEQQTERADPDGPLVPLPKREPPPRVVSAPQHDFIAALYRPWEPVA